MRHMARMPGMGSMVGYGARRNAARTALVLVQVFLLLFASVGQAVVIAADPAPSEPPATVDPSPDPTPTPSPTDAPAPDPTATPDPTADPTAAPDPTSAPARTPTIASDLPDYGPGWL